MIQFNRRHIDNDALQNGLKTLMKSPVRGFKSVLEQCTNSELVELLYWVDRIQRALKCEATKRTAIKMDELLHSLSEEAGNV